MSNPLPAAFIILAIAATSSPGEDKPPFKITTRRETDRVEVKVEKERTTISITKSWISQAVIERNCDKWPDELVLRLYLSGLERVVVWNDEVTIVGRAGSDLDKDRVQFQKRSEGGSTSIDSGHPYWIDIRPIGRDGKPADPFPLTDGYFEIKLPRPLFEGNPKSIKVEWVDWFRG